MYHVALTGNIAAGKSAVATLFRDWGATLIDADAIVRRLQQPDTPVFEAMVQRFGPAIISPDGTLNRAALRARILADPRERKALEAIVHPAVQAEQRRLLERIGVGPRIVVSDIPLLFEAGDPSRFDAVVLVDAPEPERLVRLVQQRGIAAEQAGKLIAAQLPAAEKRGRAGFIIDNDSTRDMLRERAWQVWRKLISQARSRA